ncbi:hypothetical protein DM860_012907 [Cuscuta australis]|uniref:NAC domain-containing protein n=1 Tax=Cuscuta australis TaxID=267555 RepID=A0A328DUU4_9ASTE|nr:hypothetical protein DM860_012907 [Cuscuta australis]
MGDRNDGGNNLPPGFRFSPTDEELVVHFLHRKAALLPCHPDVIPDLELYPYDPWRLNGKAMVEGKKWYFYSRRTSNRITENGFWRPIGVDQPIISSSGAGKIIGMKKFYSFYVGEPPESGVKTDWVMEEYRLSDLSASTSTKSSSRGRRRRRSAHSISNIVDHSKWVVCRVYEEKYENEGDDNGIELSCLDEVFMSLDDDDDDLDEICLPC